MIALSRLREIVLLVFIVGFASAAWAGTAQYSGSLIIQGFGNDMTGGTTYPFTTNVFLGHPFGITCNPYYGPGTKICGGTDQSAQDGSPLTGSGTAGVTDTSPAAFTLPQSALARKLGTPATPGSFEHLTNSVSRPIHCTATNAGAGCGVPGGSFSYYFPYI